MISQKQTYTIVDFQRTKQQLLHWANQHNSCCFLDNNLHAAANNFECLVGVGVHQQLICNAGHAFEQLHVFMLQHPKQWVFGHLAYDLKNEIEALSSQQPNNIGFDDLHFFIPQTVVKLTLTQITIECINQNPNDVFAAISQLFISQIKTPTVANIQARMSKEAYLKTVNILKQHILKGDCYEINFCQEFFAENANIDAVSIYENLCRISPNPFAVFYKQTNKHLLCASPERYLNKTGNRLVSQPIKGTAARIIENPTLDAAQKLKLQQSSKDQSENVMVVDLVRHDLSKICEAGTVEVTELFGVYTFPQVHQMISSIGGVLKPNIPFSAIIKSTFPMGSMTGAPKKKVMELIAQYEPTKRGLFSGAVGYISPNGNFDFNVVIRSIFYNATNGYLHYLVGGGITFNSDAQTEYEECLVKVAAIKSVLSG